MYYLLKRLVLRSAHPRAEPQKEVLFLTETVETIENISQNSNTLVQCLICAAWFAGFFIASRVFKHVVGPRLTRAAQKIERPYLSTLLQSFIRPCALFIALIGLYIGVRLLPFDFIHTDAWRTAQNHAVRIAFIVLLAWGLLGASKCVELALVGTRSRFDLGAGDTVIPMWISVITTVGIRMPLAYLWAYLTRSPQNPAGDPMCLYGSLLVAWLAGCGMSIFFYCRGKWKRGLRFAAQPHTQTEGSL